MQHSLWNMYASIRNGLVAHRRSVLQKRTSLCLEVLKVLYREGFINGFRISPGSSDLVEIFLSYNLRKPTIKGIKSVSMPGRRLYVSTNMLWKLNASVFTFIVSTPKGVMSDKECRRLSLGGEVLCVVC